MPSLRTLTYWFRQNFAIALLESLSAQIGFEVTDLARQSTTGGWSIPNIWPPVLPSGSCRGRSCSPRREGCPLQGREQESPRYYCYRSLGEQIIVHLHPATAASKIGLQLPSRQNQVTQAEERAKVTPEFVRPGSSLATQIFPRSFRGGWDISEQYPFRSPIRRNGRICPVITTREQYLPRVIGCGNSRPLCRRPRGRDEILYPHAHLAQRGGALNIIYPRRK